MALRTLRKTGTLVGLALLLSAVMIVGVIALVAALRPDDGGSTPAAAADRTPTSGPAATRAATPSAPPSSATPSSAPTSSEPSLGIDPTSATRPSSSPVANSVPPRTTTPTTPATPKAKKSITYVVKRGDNLTVIAEWFKQHGYGKLYERNRKVIGNDPDLIRPGQKITISSAGMTTSR